MNGTDGVSLALISVHGVMREQIVEFIVLKRTAASRRKSIIIIIIDHAHS